MRIVYRLKEFEVVIISTNHLELLDSHMHTSDAGFTGRLLYPQTLADPSNSVPPLSKFSLLHSSISELQETQLCTVWELSEICLLGFELVTNSPNFQLNQKEKGQPILKLKFQELAYQKFNCHDCSQKIIHNEKFDLIIKFLVYQLRVY